MTPTSQPDAWQEDDSRHFLDLGEIYTPRRDELQAAFLDLIPAWASDDFTGVDLACGGGWLTGAILEDYPRSKMIALDGSEEMRIAAETTLKPFGDRATVQEFRLEQSDWRSALPDDLTCVVSTLAIHHLDGEEKKTLFAELLPKLKPGGALLIADLVEPAGPWSERHFGRAWGNDVSRQSVEITGDESIYRKFTHEHWNYYQNTDDENEGDTPSSAADHLDWLREAGYEGVDIAWARAGHTLFCGYRGV